METKFFISHYVQIKAAMLKSELTVHQYFISHYVQIKGKGLKQVDLSQMLYIPLRSDKRKDLIFVFVLRFPSLYPTTFR